MRIFHGFDQLPRFTHPAATVGSYDGVHSGHLFLLRTVTDAAWAQEGESVVFTFEPHPRITLGTAQGLHLLTTLEEKLYLFEKLCIDNVVVIPFDEDFSRLTPEEFVRECLVEQAGVETLVVGFNHRFGRDKQGNYDYLDREDFGLKVIEVAECDVDREKVSSTVVRKLIEKGDMAHAMRMLAHPYLVIGEAENSVLRVEAMKLLPPPGLYNVHVNGEPTTVEIGTSQHLTIHGDCTDGRVVITF